MMAGEGFFLRKARTARASFVTFSPSLKSVLFECSGADKIFFTVKLVFHINIACLFNTVKLLADAEGGLNVSNAMGLGFAVFDFSIAGSCPG
jgi:hypothetical protein